MFDFQLILDLQKSRKSSTENSHKPLLQFSLKLKSYITLKQLPKIEIKHWYYSIN